MPPATDRSGAGIKGRNKGSHAMQQPTLSVHRAAAGEADRGARVRAALIAGLLGAFILLGTGFAGPHTLHNAAHDARHAFAFPCH